MARGGYDLRGQAVYFLTLPAALALEAFGSLDPVVWLSALPGDRLAVVMTPQRKAGLTAQQDRSARVRIRISDAWRAMRLPPLARFRAVPHQPHPFAARGLIVDLSSVRESQ